MPLSYTPPPRPAVVPVVPPDAITGETNRFYRLMAATLRNSGAPNYWQPVSDTTNRPQNIGTISTSPTKVTIAHTLEAIKATSLVVVPDDVLGAAGIRVTANVGQQTTDLTFVQSTPLSDFIEWNGSAWSFAKGASSPFAASGSSAVAHDAQTQTAVMATAATHNTTHTPAGTPKGAVVVILGHQNSAGSIPDTITGVTYGGVAMTRVLRQVDAADGINYQLWVYFLGSGLPTGAQTVAITSSDNATKRAVISTVTSGGNTSVDVSAGAALTTGANPSLALTFSTPLQDAMVYYGLFSGLAAPITTAEADSTHQFNHDFGSISGMWARKAVVSGASTTIGYTATSDDHAHAAVVIKGAAGGAFPSGVLTLNHADIGAADPTAVVLVPRGGTYRPVISTTDGVTSTQVNIEFYDTAGVKQTTAATGMAFSLTRPSSNRVLNPQTITTTTFPGSDITLHGMFEVQAPIGTDPGTGGGGTNPPPTDIGRPPNTPIPPGGMTAEQARVVEMKPYRAGWFAPTSYWKRQLPATGRAIYQHPTIPEANSVNWKNSLCAQMGLDGNTPTDSLTANYAAVHTDGMAWIRREGDILYIVPPDQPYRPFFNIQAGIDTWATRMQGVIDQLGGLPVPYDVEGTNNPDRYVHVYKPDENLFMQFYLAGSLDAATTTLSLVNGPTTSGTFQIAFDYADHIINPSTFTTTALPFNATAAQVKIAMDAARNASNFMFATGDSNRCQASGGPLNVAPIEVRFSVARPTQPVWFRTLISSFDDGNVAYAHHNAGPVERCRGGSVIAEIQTHPGVDEHPGTYRDWTNLGIFLEDARWGGSATSIEYMAGMPSWEEAADAQAAGTGLDHAIPFIVGHAQLSPISRVVPATRSDGDRANNPGYIAEGARFAFPSDTDLSYIQTNHPEIMWLARTLCTYGAIIYDKSGAGCEFVFRRGSWSGSTFNPWRELLPLYGTASNAPHRYMKALPWHKAQVIEPSFSAP